MKLLFMQIIFSASGPLLLGLGGGGCVRPGPQQRGRYLHSLPGKLPGTGSRSLLPLAFPQGASGLWHRVTQRKGHRAPDNNAVTCECVGCGPGALWLSEIKKEE